MPRHTLGAMRAVSGFIAGAAAVVGLVACGGSSSTSSAQSAPSSAAGTSSATSTVSKAVATMSSAVADVATDSAGSGAATPTVTRSTAVAAGTGKSIKPCSLVTPALLKRTLGTDASAAKFEPLTVVGTGCRFTRTTRTASSNILVEVTTDAAQYLPELAYSAPAGSHSVPGTDRGYVAPPAPGMSNGFMLLVKGGNGVFVSLFQDHPRLTTASELKLAAAIVAQL